MTFKSINPYNNEVLEEFEPFNKEKIEYCLNKAEDTFSKWRKTDFKTRSNALLKASEILKKNKKDYGKVITMEMGKPLVEAIAEVEKCSWVCEYYAENAEKFLKDETVSTSATTSYVRYQPIGAVLAIMPWNFPYWQVFRFAAPALMAGNVGLLKHAPNVLKCALQIEDIFKQAGIPEGAFQNLIIDVHDVETVIKSPIVKAVTLTGSERAGSSVASIAGKNIKKTVLELGGSNAFVVLDDADLEEAVKVGVQARMLNCGQSCIAAKRFILHKDIADKFTELFKAKVEEIKVSDPLDSSSRMGPLARKDLADNLKHQVEASIAKGAELITGGEQNNAIFSPTILKNVKPGMPAFDEELFGPVAALIVVQDDNEALKLANQSKYGLGATVFTKNTNRAKLFIDNIEDGAVFINALVKSDPRLPFGGTKNSGYGRELSEHGIREFVNVKTVYIENM